MSRLLFLFLAAALLTLAVSCGGDDADEGPQFAFGLDATIVAGDGNADAVSAIAFAPDGRMFYAEQFKGTIRILLPDGSLQTAPFATIPVATWLDLDWGLTGLALDPDYETNRYVYAFFTAPVRENIGKPTLVRFTDNAGVGEDETTISDDFPETIENFQGYNANGEIHFGPDGFLYASVGDYNQGGANPDDGGQPELLGDMSTPVGKMLRMTADGEAAPGNPFEDEAGADARIYATGFREPFPFTFSPDGTLYGTDNTPYSCEELNVIEAGGNYGWPDFGTFPYADCTIGPGNQPIHNFSREGNTPGGFLSLVEVSGLSFLEGSTYTGVTDSLIVCESEKSPVGEVVSPGVLRRLVLSDPETVATSDVITKDCKGEAVSNNGVVYYANSNQIKKLIQTEEGAGQTIPPQGTAPGQPTIPGQPTVPPPGG